MRSEYGDFRLELELKRRLAGGGPPARIKGSASVQWAPHTSVRLPAVRNTRSGSNMNSLTVLVMALVATTSGVPQFRPQPQPTYAGGNAPIPILKQTSEINPDGSYAWSYETGNGIAADESGALENPGQKDLEAMRAQGSFSYTAPDGTPIQVRYVADRDGFHPEGAHLPTPPPIPEAIQRSLAFIASQPQQPGSQPNQPFNRPQTYPRPGGFGRRR